MPRSPVISTPLTRSAAVAEAIRSWQSPLEDAVELQAVAGSGSAAIGNSTSELGWESLPPEVVSLTRIVSRSGRIIEADVSVARDCASRGPWSLDAIVSHEMGHTLGLGHADDGGIAVSAVMAADPSNTSATITRDDVAGVNETYRRHDAFARLPGSVLDPSTSAFPPRNEPFVFRQQLETTYRDGSAPRRRREFRGHRGHDRLDAGIPALSRQRLRPRRCADSSGLADPGSAASRRCAPTSPARR